MLEIRNVTKVYKSKHGQSVTALDNVSINFGDKGLIFLLGKSGSGKSTILNTIGGLDKFDSGEVVINGKSSKTFKQADFDAYRNTYVGFIFQEYNVLPEFNVEKNIALAIELQGKKSSRDKVDELLEMVDMTGYNKRKPNQLSGGQKQRLAIARALIKDPQIIMADEPTGALDSNTGRQVFDTLKRLSANKLVIVVSHDRENAEIYADRIIELKDGRIISDRTKHKTQPKNQTESLTVVNNSIMHIRSGSSLSSSEQKLLSDVISRTNSELFVVANPDVNKEIRRIARIDNNGYGEEFVRTTDDDIKRDDKATSFKTVKSKLKSKDAMKMGYSSLKHKRGKLVISMFLTIFAICIFAFADTAASFDQNSSMQQTVADLKSDSLTFAKKYSSKLTDPDSTSTYLNNAYISESDLSELKSEYPSRTFWPSYRTPIYNFFIERGMHIQSAYIITEDLRSKFDFTLLAGRLPTNASEVVITKAMFECCRNRQIRVDNGSTTVEKRVSSMDEMIGVYIPNTSSKYKVVGIIDTKLDEKWLTDFVASLDSEGGVFSGMANLGILECGPHFAYYLYDDTDIDDSSDSGVYLHTSDLDGYLGFSCSVTAQNEGFPANTTKFSGYSTLTKLGKKQAVLSISCSINSYYRYYENTYQIDFYTNVDRLGLNFTFIPEHGDNGNVYASEAEANAKIADIKTQFSNWWSTNIVNNSTNLAIIAENLGKFGFSNYSDSSLIKPTFVGITYHWGNNNVLTISPESRNDFGSEVTRSFITSGAYYAVTCTSSGSSKDRQLVADLCDYKTTSVTYTVQNEASGVLESFGSTLKSMTTAFLYIGIAFAIFSALLVMSYIGNSISYKKKEIGVLRALGATGRDVYRIFTWESLIILGIVAAISLIILFGGCIAVNIVMKNQLGIYITLLVVGIRQIALVCGVCFVIALIASFFPTFRISRMQPIDAMQERK